MDWFKGKILTGNHGFSHEIWNFPVNFRLNQSSECLIARRHEGNAVTPDPNISKHQQSIAWSDGMSNRWLEKMDVPPRLTQQWHVCIEYHRRSQSFEHAHDFKYTVLEPYKFKSVRECFQWNYFQDNLNKHITYTVIFIKPLRICSPDNTVRPIISECEVPKKLPSWLIWLPWTTFSIPIGLLLHSIEFIVQSSKSQNHIVGFIIIFSCHA